MGMYNGPIGKKTIGKNYTKPQQELVERILRAISSDEDGYRRITRNGTFDGSGSFEGCGALIFGEPAEGTEVRLGLHRPPPDGPLRRQLGRRRGLRRPDVLRPQPQRLQRAATSSTTRPRAC